ncbi:MAG: hypothetical protein JKY65_19115 [Planctomycetes bacterium]|nr:hypothetical protein [Planctomycetota bacterium]
MRTLFALSLLLLVPSSAFAKPKELTAQRFAKAIGKAVRKADAKSFEACCHSEFWAASKDSGKLLFQQLTTQGVESEFQRKEQQVVGERSLLPLRLTKGAQVLGRYVLRIEFKNDRWGISAADEVKPEDSKWLAAGLKEGTAKTPEEALKALIQAIATKDKPQARLHSTEAGWHPPGDYLFTLYRQAVKKELVLSMKDTPLVKDSRAVALVDVARKGRVVDRIVLYLVKRSGWLLAGLDEDEEHGRAYLAGKATAKVWPSSPGRLSYQVNSWQEGRQTFRSVWSEAGWKQHGKALYERLSSADPHVYTGARDREIATAARVVIVAEVREVDDDAPMFGEEGGAPSNPKPVLELLFFLAEDSPAGWRLTGVAKDLAAAKAWRAGK